MHKLDKWIPDRQYILPQTNAFIVQDTVDTQVYKRGICTCNNKIHQSPYQNRTLRVVKWNVVFVSISFFFILTNSSNK